MQAHRLPVFLHAAAALPRVSAAAPRFVPLKNVARSLTSTVRTCGLNRFAPPRSYGAVQSFHTSSLPRAKEAAAEPVHKPIAANEPSRYPGAVGVPFTTDLNIEQQQSKIPIYRVMDNSGQLIDGNHTIKAPKEQLIKMYETMCRVHTMDQIFYDAQRQGRISFYMTSFGEEASVVGSAAALDPNDVVFCQYREQAIFMWRGFSIGEFADQCFSNARDRGKGRQMPVHYGSNRLNIQTISSPLSTQIPQAVGSAYALKRAKKDNVVMCYFGDGAASEGDFHAALNFASTLDCPVIFFCRNNGWAISTPTAEQYHADGIAARAVGYGIHRVRVDGNDLLAVLEATQAARELSVTQKRPVLIEAMSYRGGHHSTSDDSTRYRDIEEIRYWSETNNPLNRTRLFLESQHWWDSDKETALQQSARKEVLNELTRAESEKKPAITELFTDVYDSLPPHLLEQQQQLKEHLAKYGDKYHLNTYESPEDQTGADRL